MYEKFHSHSIARSLSYMTTITVCSVHYETAMTNYILIILSYLC